jgi:hypothetical protein
MKSGCYRNHNEVMTMQISRHWRLNSKRYRLEGVRYEDGAVSLQERPLVYAERENTTEVKIIRNERERLALAV